MNYNYHITATIILLILDVIWISLFMGPQYGKLVQNIQGSPMKLNLLSATLSYILMVLGLNIFVLPKITNDNILTDSLFYGFTFGIILYGVYDFTAGSVLKNWDFKLAFFDIIWGGIVYFISSYVAKKLT